MRYGALAAIVLTVAQLTGCASTQQADPRDAALAQHLTYLEQQIGASKMTRREAAISARDKTRELGIADAYTDEVWAYRIMLAGQVERGEVSNDQAAYLDQQKVNQVVERAQAAANQRAPAAPFGRPVTCRPDGWGGVRCR